MPNDSHRPDVAVFIDFENVYVSVRDKLDANPNFESIMERCEDFGRVVIARAYADWYRYPRVTSALYANGIEPMYVPTYYYDRDMGRTGRPIKNSVDMQLCVEAMKTLYTNPNIAKFVLATGDRDFIPLVNTIRQQGKEVIVIGIGGAASAHLAQSADEFIFYETLVGKQTPRSTIDDIPRAKMPEKGREGYDHSEDAPTAPRRERTERPERTEPIEVAAINSPSNGNGNLPSPANVPTEPDVYDTLVRAINLARERGYVCSFGSLKLLMKELMGGEFKESRYKDSQGRPFAKFKDFVMDAERRDKVQVFTSGTVNEVFLPGEDPYKLSQFAAELKVDPDASPIELTEQIAENRSDSRASNPGRRRRRRRSGRQSDRQNGETGLEEGDDEFENEELESAPMPELVLPDLMDATAAAEVFEELLDRIESEDAQSAALVDTDPYEILEPDTSEVAYVEAVPTKPLAEIEALSSDMQAEDVVTATETAADDSGLARTRPFGEADWQFLAEVLSDYGKPASFAQIHDLLRGARTRMSVVRTNEELRTLAKQAINNGLLARQGKGNRISYKLAETAPADENEVEPTDQMALIEQAVEGEQVVNTDTSSDETTATELPSTGSPLLDGLAEAAELASDPEQARAEVAKIQGEVTALALEPASELSGVASIAPVEEEAEQAKPNRSRRRKNTGQTAEAATAEVAAKPAGGRRRKATAAASAPEPPAAETEAKPKRPRRKAPVNEE